MASPSAGASVLKYGDVNTVTPSPGEVKGLIKNFNSSLSRFKSEGVDDKLFQICFKYKTSVDELKPKGELAFV